MRPMRVPLMVAISGVAALALLFPRFDPTGKLGAVLDRRSAVAKTRQFAAANGVKAEGWRAEAAERLESPTGPLTIEVALIEPGGVRRFEAEWFPNGKLASSRLPDAPPSAKSRSAADVEIADTGNVHVKVSGDQAPQQEKLVYLAARVVAALWYFAMLAYFCVGAIRRRLRYRVALILTAALVISVAAGYWGGTRYQKGQIRESSDTAEANERSRSTAIFWIFVAAAAGYSVRGAINRRKWSTVELLARGNLFSRQVGVSAATGLLTGIGFAAVPYVIAASRLFPRSALIFRSTELLVAPVPWLAAFDLTPAAWSAGLFGLTVPLLANWKRRRLGWLLIAAAGVGAVGLNEISFSSPGANLLTSAVLFGACLLLYLRTDVLAVIIALVASQAAIGPCVLLAQPGGQVRALAFPLLLVWALVLAAALHVAVRGRVDDELPAAPSLEPVEEIETPSGRARLEAEFEVARKAQEATLPATPPVLAGYSLAASCTPAQQVGGDLYDFFPLPDGRTGIAVADVSGKGVPAALYMMLTKGLLAAITRQSSDLGYILRQINLHLHRACKKKVFVTLAAIALTLAGAASGADAPATVPFCGAALFEAEPSS